MLGNRSNPQKSQKILFASKNQTSKRYKYLVYFFIFLFFKTQKFGPKILGKKIWAFFQYPMREGIVLQYGVLQPPQIGKECITKILSAWEVECKYYAVERKKEQSFCFYVLKFRFFSSSFLFRLSSYSLHGCQPVARVGVSSKIEK